MPDPLDFPSSPPVAHQPPEPPLERGSGAPRWKTFDAAEAAKAYNFPWHSNFDAQPPQAPLLPPKRSSLPPEPSLLPQTPLNQDQLIIEPQPGSSRKAPGTDQDGGKKHKGTLILSGETLLQSRVLEDIAKNRAKVLSDREARLSARERQFAQHKREQDVRQQEQERIQRQQDQRHDAQEQRQREQDQPHGEQERRQHNQNQRHDRQIELLRIQDENGGRFRIREGDVTERENQIALYQQPERQDQLNVQQREFRLGIL